VRKKNPCNFGDVSLKGKVSSFPISSLLWKNEYVNCITILELDTMGYNIKIMEQKTENSLSPR
jgi:hypothetical protein